MVAALFPKRVKRFTPPRSRPAVPALSTHCQPVKRGRHDPKHHRQIGHGQTARRRSGAGSAAVERGVRITMARPSSVHRSAR